MKDCEKNLWMLVKIQKQKIELESQKNIVDKLVYVTDTMINLASISLKIAARLPIGRISKSEITKLLSSTNFEGKVPVIIDNITSLNINQTIIFGIGNNQSIKLPKQNP